MSPPPNTNRLTELGYLFPVSAGIQIDLNVVKGGSLCDHNCTTELGGYDCPDAFTRSKPGTKVFASADTIIQRVLIAREGLMAARKAWLSSQAFSQYCELYEIPDWVREAIRLNILEKPCEVNLFGGNPEMHPELFKIIAALKAAGFRVNLTTTGRKFITDENFAAKFKENPPHLLALSLDDVEPQELEELLTIPLADLKKVWKATNPLFGQRQKMLEGIYAARLAKNEGWDCKTLFNMVMSPKNLSGFSEILTIVAKHLPAALLNAYPAQDSFDYGPGVFSEKNTLVFKQQVSTMIESTIAGDPNITKRLPYWLVMSAVFENCGNDHLTAAGKLISGHHIWQCYNKFGTGMYAQIGQPNTQFAQIGDNKEEPGGYLGCYWNHQTVTSPAPLVTADDVVTHLNAGMRILASNNKPGAKRCPGCSMPRLWFDGPNTENGLNDGLRNTYLRLRKTHMGF